MPSTETTPLRPHQMDLDLAVILPRLFSALQVPQPPREAPKDTHVCIAQDIIGCPSSMLDVRNLSRAVMMRWNNPTKAVGISTPTSTTQVPATAMRLVLVIKKRGASSIVVVGSRSRSCSYQQLAPPPSGKLDEESGAQGPVEMVTVPALGPEWGKDELKGMTSRARREEKAENFGRKWKLFNRGEYGLCGSKWLTRRTLIFIIFGICVVYVLHP